MTTLIWPRRPLGRAGALALAVMLPACGGGGGSNTPTPVGPVRTQIGNTSFTVLGTVDANREGFERDEVHGPLTLPQSGALEIIVDWTFASNDLDIVLYNGTCSFQLLITVGCPILAQTTSATQKPERLSLNANAGSYTIGITNYGRTNESGTIQVFLTR